MCVTKWLWRDENGFIVSSELVLLASVILIPMLVGMQSVRNSVVQELGDVGEALGNVVQTYSYQGVAGHYSVAFGSQFYDLADQCERQWGNNNNCLNVGTGLGLEDGASVSLGPVNRSSRPLIWNSGIQRAPAISQAPTVSGGSDLSLPIPDSSQTN